MSPCTNGRGFILIQFDMTVITKEKMLLEERSALYGAVSALFADPESQKFELLLKPEIQGSVLDTCFQLESTLCGTDAGLSKPFQQIMAKLSANNLKKIQSEFVDVFGHTLSKQIAPYALEHLKNTDVFFRTQKLADLNGFYKAFGMEVESIERADHISTQTEFLSYLLLKERLAERNGLIEEMGVCRDAFDQFQKDHFMDWAGMFAGNLAKHVDSEFYPLAGRFFSISLETEKYYGSSMR